MQKVHPAMRLKVNRDTFFYPEASKGVYLRNNIKSIRMEGSTIARWLEKLIPMLDGTHSLEYVTNGLPDSFKEQVYKIAQVLYENGFARDVSQDLPHQLPEHILKKYASQIEYLNHVKNSGGYRFEMYRQTTPAVMGSGTLLLSFVLALIESGLTAFSIVQTDINEDDDCRLKELIAEAFKLDPESAITLIKNHKNWKESLKPFQTVLYGSIDDQFDQLRAVHAYCREQGKTFLPVTLLQDIAFAGPLVHPKTNACWESAYRRLHHSPFKEKKPQTSSHITCSLLANVAVFELFKEITGLYEKDSDRPLYLLNTETLEGNWQSIIPHPVVNGQLKTAPLHDPLAFLEQSKKEQSDLFNLFYTITSKECGIFYVWEEGELEQLPLSQCKVQTADPLSNGRAKLLPELICSGFTHEEARLDAGLNGIETYMKRVYDNAHDAPAITGVGTGKTAAEGLCRALLNSLHHEFIKRTNEQELSVSISLDITNIKDERCLYFLQALQLSRSVPTIYLGKPVLGFPVIYVRSNGMWFGSVGLNEVMAVSRALQAALLTAQNNEINLNPYGAVFSSLSIRTEKQQAVSCQSQPLNQTFSSALVTLQKNNIKPQFFHLSAERLLNKHLAGIFGVTLMEEST